MWRRRRAIRLTSSKLPSGQLGARADPVGIVSREVATTSHAVETASRKEAIAISAVTVARRPMTIVGRSSSNREPFDITVERTREIAQGREKSDDSRRYTPPSRASTSPIRPMYVRIHAISTCGQDGHRRAGRMSRENRVVPSRSGRSTSASGEEDTLDRGEDAPRATQNHAWRAYVSACGTHIKSRARDIAPRRRRNDAAPAPLAAGPT